MKTAEEFLSVYRADLDMIRALGRKLTQIAERCEAEGNPNGLVDDPEALRVTDQRKRLALNVLYEIKRLPLDEAVKVYEEFPAGAYRGFLRGWLISKGRML